MMVSRRKLKLFCLVIIVFVMIMKRLKLLLFDTLMSKEEKEMNTYVGLYVRVRFNGDSRLARQIELQVV